MIFGMSISNFMIYVSFALFIVAYYAVTAYFFRNEKKKNEGT